MYLSILAIVAFGVLIQLLLNAIGKKLKLFSKESFRRKIGERIPLTGGMGILLTLLTAQFFITDEISQVILISATLLCVGAILDDKYELSAKVKVLFQVLSAIAFIHMTGIENLFYYKIIGNVYLSYFVTVLFTVVVMNAYNFLDGIDGQLSLITLIATVGIGVISEFNSHIFVVLLAANACFFVFNFYKAKIYLGELGSSLLGFLMASLALRIEPVENSWVSFWSINFLFSLPFCDVWAAIFRRISRGQNPWSGDKEHFHHKLEKLGLNSLMIIMISGSIMLISTSTAYLLLKSAGPSSLLLILSSSFALSIIYFGVFAVEKVVAEKIKEFISLYLGQKCAPLSSISTFHNSYQFIEFDFIHYVLELQKNSLVNAESFLLQFQSVFSESSQMYYGQELKVLVQTKVPNEIIVMEWRNEVCKKINNLLIENRLLIYEKSIPTGLSFFSSEDIRARISHLKLKYSVEGDLSKDKTFKQS